VLQNANSAHTPLAMFDQINPASWRIDLNVLAYDITVSALIVAVAVVIAYLIYRAAFHLVSRVTRVSETVILTCSPEPTSALPRCRPSSRMTSIDSSSV